MRIIPQCTVDIALAHAARGFAVFPLKPDSKLPAVKGWPHLATSDVGKIRELWADAPAANVGIYTGAAFESDHIAVVDVDVKKGKPGLESLAQLEREHGELPPTLTVTTPTGGKHLYFRVPVPVSSPADKFAPGIDIRSAGAYVVGPGSVVDDKAYEVVDPAAPIADAPPWLVERLCRMAQPMEKRADNVVPLIRPDKEEHIEKAISYLQRSAPLAVQGAGGDRTTFSVACEMHACGVSEHTALELMLEHFNDRCSPPWMPDELAVKVANAYRYRNGQFGSATAEAQFQPIEEPAAESPPSPRARGLSFRLFKDVKPSFAQSGLVRGLLDRGAMSVVYGESNSGKTFFALDVAFHVATGRDWGGRRVEQGAVVYVAAEGGRGIEQRMQALKIHHQLEGEDVPLALVACPVNLLSPKADTAALISLVKDVEAQTGQQVALIVIDTLARAMAGGDENTFQDMAAFVGNVDRIRTETGAHVSVVHHSGKDTSRGARGHSSLRAATDTEIEIANNTATVTKQRDMEIGKPIGFKLRPVELGSDEDGSVITSCVVALVDHGAVRDFTKKKPAPIAASALAVLKQLIDTEGEERGTHPFTQGAKAVPVARWREAFYAGQSSVSFETARKQFTRSLSNLGTSNHIYLSDGFVWLLE